jgi:ABC-2 type transport system ATP-binding protein
LQFTAAAYQVRCDADRTAELIDYFDLTEKQYTPAEELSRGMRQKLAICCAFLHDPGAILFDEPLTGLDPRAIRKLKDSMVERSRRGCAIIISSHLLAMVEDICTDFLILEDGLPKFLGPRQQLLDRVDGTAEGSTLEEVFFRVTEAPHSALVIAD